MFYKECQKYHFSFILAAIIALVVFSASCGVEAAKQKHLERGETFLQQRKFQEAVMEFRAVADIDKNSVDAHWGLVRAREGQGDVFETINELRTVISLDDKHLDAKTKLGNYYLLLDPPQIPDTEKIITEIFAVDPNFVEGHILRASVLSAQERPEKEVVEVLNHAISLNPARQESYLSLARYFMKIDKTAEAEETIKKAISVNEKSVLGYLEYGRFFSYSNKPEEAEAQFKKAIETDPKNIEANEALAGFYLSQNQIEKAEAAFKNLVAIQENSPEGRMQLGDFYDTVGRKEEAVNVFNSILADAPEYVRARYRLAETYLERKENEKVYEQIEKLLAINDSDTEALMLRARLKIQENKAEEAISDLEEILKKQPSLKNGLYYMVQARLAAGQVDQARAFIGDLEKYHPKYIYTKLLKIQTSFAAGENQKALQEANDLLTAATYAYPTAEVSQQKLEQLRISALSARGQAFLALGQINESRVDLKEVLRLSPNSSSANVNLARLELTVKNYTESLSLYEKAFELEQKNFDALNGIVAVFKRQKQFQQAQERIDQVIAASGDQKDVLASLHYLKADVFSAENNLDAAAAELQKSLEFDPEYLPAYSASASILAAQNQIDQAIAQYKKLIEKKPSAAIFSLIGMLEDAKQNYDEAEKNYREALKLSPEMPIAANNLAWIIAAYDRGNLDEALQFAQKCVDKNSNVAGYYDTLGLVYYKKGLLSPAVEQFKKAVALDDAEAAKNGVSVNPAYRVRLAMALASAGDKMNAKKEVEAALKREHDLSQTEAEEAKKLLAAL